MLKMSQRVEKYMICACVDSRQEKAAIFEAISHYQGVILCDVPGQLRNDLLKYCFSRQMRTYVVPEISDIIVRGGEEIRLICTAAAALSKQWFANRTAYRKTVV